MIILHRRFKVEFYFKLVLVRQDRKKSLNTSDFDSFSVLLGTRIIRKQAGLSACILIGKEENEEQGAEEPRYTRLPSDTSSRR